jgi:ligand-binding sensor domain-containing protein/signal transduction histidine kinase
MHRLTALIIILGFLLSIEVEAQGVDKRFNHITIEDGLSQSSVRAILQDSKGFMWFGTEDGLNRYDGHDFTVFKTVAGNPNSLSDNNINTLFEDSKQRIWIGTQSGGLTLYDWKKNQFTNYTVIDDQEHRQQLSSNTIWAITEDHEGLIWVGTSSGLNLFDPVSGRFHQIFSDSEEGSLSGNHISNLFVDNDGVLWVGTNNGLNKMDREGGGFKQFQTAEIGSSTVLLGMIRSIYQDYRGSLWIGTDDQGLFLLDDENELFTRYVHEPGNPNSISGNAVFSVLEDDIGNLWVGTGNDGINIFDRDNEIFHRYQQSSADPYSISTDSINEIYKSKEGIIWIGTFAGGINFYNLEERFFNHFVNDPGNVNSLSNNIVQSIREGPEGTLWIGTDGGGLNQFDPVSEEFKRIPSIPGNNQTPSSNIILDIERTESGMWLATYGGGVDFFNFDTQQYRNFSAEPANLQRLSSPDVFTINKSRDGNLWFSTNGGGISELEPVEERFRHFRLFQDKPDEPYTLRNDDARIAFEESNGDIWMGTHGGLIHRYVRGDMNIKVYSINEHNHYSASLVQTILEDENGTLWFGSRGGGLLRYDRELDRVIPYATTDDGLPSNIIHTLLRDHHGMIWMSTNNGISRLNPAISEFSNLNVEHGLHTREFKPRSGTVHSDGTIYFGTVSGLIRFHPDNLRIDETTYPVILTELLLFNRRVLIGDDSPLNEFISELSEISLSHGNSVITIGYTSLNFRRLKGDQFAYRLLGFEEDWNFVGGQRRATYTNLSPGKYEFQVMSANNYGIWNEDYSALTIIIVTPFWRTWWFMVLMILLILLVSIEFYRYRMNLIRTEQIRLEKKIMERTKELLKSNSTKDKLFSIIAHDLRNYATSIIGLSALINENSKEGNFEEIKGYAEMLEKAAYQFHDFLKNLLEWARYQTDKIKIEPKVFSLEDVVSHVAEQSGPNANSKGIDIKVYIEEDLKVFADPNLFAIAMFNLINNAVKFSHPKGRIEVRGKTIGSNRVEISVQDYGVGMTEESVEKLLAGGQAFTKQGTAGEKGTGLGFDLCKDFVEKNGGSIKIDSKVGEGTTVRFTLSKDKTGDNNDTEQKSIRERYFSMSNEEEVET